MILMMERPERYDPEDIEHLMLERPFDALLAEEKAYVLRHLRDGAEYGRMRALLLHVQEDMHQAPLAEDPAVRERVLRAFRDARRPGWRIWLNSLGAFLLPARPVYYWRPVLALGVVALLVVSSLSLWNALYPTERNVLAEVHEVPSPATVKQAEVKAPEGAVSSANEANPPVPAPMILPEANARQRAPMRMEAKEELDQAKEQAEVAEVSAAMAETAPPPPPGARMAAADARPHTAYADAQAMTITMDTPGEALAKPAKPTLAEEAATADHYTEDNLLGLLRAAW